MVNHRLRAAISAAGLSQRQLAEELNVTPKTIERWVGRSRVPYPRHRALITSRFGMPETYFWPSLAVKDEVDGIGTDEIVRVYSHRSRAPASLWDGLLDQARRRIDILVHTGLFLVDQQPDFVAALADKAATGARVRVLLADPDCAAVAGSSGEEGTGDAARTSPHRAIDCYKPLRDVAGSAVKVHAATLHASIYQFDDHMLVNTHVYGVSDAHAPLLHLRHTRGGPLWETYIMSFERVWQNATPAWPEPYPRSA